MRARSGKRWGPREHPRPRQHRLREHRSREHWLREHRSREHRPHERRRWRDRRPPQRFRWARRMHGDRGAGSVLAVAIVAALVAVTALALPLYMVLSAKQAVGGAADAAALAAADVRVGILPGEPCAVAARVASANGAQLGACEFDGLVVTVTARTSVAGLAVEASATAGPAAAGRSPPLQRHRQ